MSSFEIEKTILYRDDALIVLDKPAGIAVHAGSGRDQGIDRFFEALTFGSDRTPALAHRLDKDTSGCLVLGRSRESLARLGKLFQRGAVEKTYWAVVVGVPQPAEGTIAIPLARRSHDRRSWIMKTTTEEDPEAERAVTDYRVMAAGDGLALLALFPKTGRTHQLRVHCAAKGWPIAGDPIYGGDRARAAARKLHLHARRIVVPPGQGHAPVDVTAPVPEHMHGLIRLIGCDPQAIEVRQEAVPA